MEASQGFSRGPRARMWRQIVHDIETSPASEITAGEGYRKALGLLREQDANFGEQIWQDIPPARSRTLRGERRQLRADISILEALLKRITTVN